MPDMIPRVLTAIVRRRVIEGAVQLMTRAGCLVSTASDVTDSNGATHVRIDVVIPRDSVDPHGERLAQTLALQRP